VSEKRLCDDHAYYGEGECPECKKNDDAFFAPVGGVEGAGVSFREHAIGAATREPALKDEIAALRAEVERLRAAIEAAPHHYNCESMQCSRSHGHRTKPQCPCDCWKSKALEGSAR
jgi:hypothetical protein